MGLVVLLNNNKDQEVTRYYIMLYVQYFNISSLDRGYEHSLATKISKFAASRTISCGNPFVSTKEVMSVSGTLLCYGINAVSVFLL